MEKTLGYHFTDGMKLRDGQELIIGKTYVHEGPIEICKSGLHASRRVIDALQYAPSGTFSIVECSDIVEEHRDKFVCRERKVLETHDVSEIIRDYAFEIAEEVVRKYWKVVGDTRPLDAIRITRLYLDGKASKGELVLARNAASEAGQNYRRLDNVNYCNYCVANTVYYFSDAAAGFAPYSGIFLYASRAAGYFLGDEIFLNELGDEILNEYNTRLTQRLQKVFKTKLN